MKIKKMLNGLAAKLALRGSKASKEVENELRKLEATEKDFLEMGLAVGKAFGGAAFPKS
jgi:hypothetical protein